MVDIFIVIKHHDNMVARDISEVNIKMAGPGGKHSDVRLIPNPQKIIGSLSRGGVSSTIPPILKDRITINSTTFPEDIVGDGVSSV